MNGVLLYKKYLNDDNSTKCIKKFEKKFRTFAIKHEKEEYKNIMKDLKLKLQELNKKEKLTKRELRIKKIYQNDIEGYGMFINNKELLQRSINHTIDFLIRSLCNENCKSTLYEIGNKDELPKKWLETLGDLDLEKNKVFLKIYYKIRRRFYSGTSFTKNTLTDEEIKMFRELGIISYCTNEDLRDIVFKKL